MGTIQSAELLFEHGDHMRDIQLLERLAMEGNSQAQIQLAKLELAGRRGAPDAAIASRWIRAAAMADTPEGLFELGTLYSKGLGVPLDLAQASAWYHLSHVAGHHDGERMRDALMGHLPRSQRLEAQRTVRNFVRPLRTKDSPREIMAADFKLSDAKLPIAGGWGYTKEDACVIERSELTVQAEPPFDGICIEKLVVEKRIYEEMIIFRSKGDQFAGISWDLKTQRLIEDGNRAFDKLEYEISGFHDEDWQALKTEYEGPEGVGASSFDAEAHELKRQDRMVKFNRDFWFDITSFYGRP